MTATTPRDSNSPARHLLAAYEEAIASHLDEDGDVREGHYPAFDEITTDYGRDALDLLRAWSGASEALMTAVNAAADLVHDGLGLGDRDMDVLNLVVNATATLIDNPDATLDDVITEQYSTDPEELRGWWGDWS